MKAEEILTKYVKGDVCRDYSKKDKKYYTVTVETALKAIEEALNFYSKTKQMKAKDITIKALEYKNRRFQSQLKERGENAEVIRLLKNALEYYHNDKFANRAKSMKSLIEDALDILKTKYNP